MTLRDVGVLGAFALIGLGGCGGSPAGSVPSDASPGQRVYADAGCGGCHTLSAAHSTGTVGKKLDGAMLSAGMVTQWVRAGGGGMPSFKQQLTATQIQQVSEFVASASR